MANTIRIKRSTTTATPSSLAQGELAYSESGGVGSGELFIGVAGPGVEKVGGYADVQKLAGIAAGANNYSHPNHSGDVTSVGDGTQTIAAGAVTLSKMAQMATASILGRSTAGTGDVEVLSKASVLTLLNVEDGADVTDATNVDAAGAVMNTDTSTASMSFVIDEDTMSSNSDTKVPTQQSVKAYVDTVVSGGAGGLIYRGGYNASTNSPDLDTSPSGVLKGDSYTVTAAGTFFTEELEIGDLIIAEIANPTVLGDWTIVQSNIGPASDTVPGYVELATIAETNTGTDATRAVTPDGLDGWTGSVQLTTLGTITTGTWTASVIGDSYLPAASLSASGIIEIATQGEVDTGSDTVRAVVPAYLHATTFDGGTF